MKLVYVSDAIYPYNKGGKEKRLYEITTRLAKMGHDVHIYTMHWWSTPEKERTENDVQLHALCKHHDLYSGDRRSIKEGILFGLACLKLITVKFDILDVDHMPFFPVFSAWLVCKLRGRKLYGTWHEALSKQDWTNYMGKSGIIAAAIERASIKLPYKITAASAQTKRLLAQNHGRTKRVNLVASGIDTQALAKIKPAKAKCDVLYVGRLVKDKNVDQLIRAVAIAKKTNPEIKCVIIGHGVEKPKLELLIRKLKLTRQVSILAPLSNAQDIYAYMKRASVFALPSVREGFGIVALEALACGTPVITIDAPANAAKDLVDTGKTGSVIKLDATLIAESILFWISKNQKPTTAKHIKRYEWNAIVTGQSEVYAI